MNNAKLRIYALFVRSYENDEPVIIGGYGLTTLKEIVNDDTASKYLTFTATVLSDIFEVTVNNDGYELFKYILELYSL